MSDGYEMDLGDGEEILSQDEINKLLDIIFEIEPKTEAIHEEETMSIQTFNKLMLSLGNQAIRKVMRECDESELAKALLLAYTKVHEKVLNNMSKRQAAALKEDLGSIDSAGQKDAEEAQDKIISVIRHLEDTGKIVINSDKEWKFVAKASSIEELADIAGDINEDDIVPDMSKFDYTVEVTDEFNVDKYLYDEMGDLIEELLDQNAHELSINGNADDSQCSLSPEKCRNLTSLEIVFWKSTELPSWIRHADSLQHLSVCYSKIKTIPDWIGDLQSLTELSLKYNSLETLPDSIGNLQSLTKLSLENNKNLKTLPDSIGNLKNLTTLDIQCSTIKQLPDSVGNLRSLMELSLAYNKNLEYLPNNIGSLKDLIRLDICGSPVKQLPVSIENLSALKYVNIYATDIHSVPKSVSSAETFIDRMPTGLIPEELPSYRGFVNCYYKLTKTVLRLNEKAKREGLLSLEDEFEFLGYDLFSKGIRLAMDGTDASIIRDILKLSTICENDYYKKKLMEIATEGVLGIQSGEDTPLVIMKLGSMVKIENNPIDAAWIKYTAGDENAFSNIDFDAAIQPEGEREEIRLIKRATTLCEKAHREGLPAIEKELDHEAVTNRDIFEYGLCLYLKGICREIIDDILSLLIMHETDPVQENIGKAKKEAIHSIFNGDNTQILKIRLFSYFDKSITDAFIGNALDTREAGISEGHTEILSTEEIFNLLASLKNN